MTATDSELTLAVPGTPLAYPNGLECVWRFIATDAGQMTVTFHHFDLEPAGDLIIIGMFTIFELTFLHIGGLIIHETVWNLKCLNFTLAGSNIEQLPKNIRK